MTKKLVKLLEIKARADAARHPGAKGVVKLTPEEQKDVDDFLQAWDQHWVDSADTSRLVEDDGFHPSSLGIYAGKCGRRNIYLLRGTEKVPNFHPRTLRIFGNGHAVHDRLQKSLETMDVDFQTEIVIHKDLPMPVRGHADGALTWRGRDIAVEIKSCSETVFENRIKWNKAKDEHFEQVNIYARVMGLDIIWIIYESKNTQELLLFEMKADPERADKILNKWYMEWLVYQDGKQLARPYKEDSEACQSCDVQHVCFADEGVVVDVKPYKQKVRDMRKEQSIDQLLLQQG